MTSEVAAKQHSDSITDSDKLNTVREIEGFPIGEDDDIRRMSSPPDFTAYPNPEIRDLIEKFGKPYDEATDAYNKLPLVGDTSEGKNNPIYVLHTYHTKVPHLAIAKFIEHFTEKGDIVLDAFSGSGMTGIASNSLGRHCILSDLSPFAAFLSYAYNIYVDPKALRAAGECISKKVCKELCDLYSVSIGQQPAIVNYLILSEKFVCPYCGSIGTFWDVLFDAKNQLFRENIFCQNCNGELTQRDLDKVRNQDGSIERVPVWIDYTLQKRRAASDLPNPTFVLSKQISAKDIPYWYPQTKMMFKGEYWGEMYVKSHHKGMTTVADFFTPKNLYALALIWKEISAYEGMLRKKLEFAFTSIVQRASVLNRLRPSFAGDPMTGTLYVASIIREENVLNLWDRKIDAIAKGTSFSYKNTNNQLRVQAASTTDLRNIPSECIDYIFIDPPFGRNLMYSELNFIWEAWFKVFTNNNKEIIKSRAQNKNVEDYRKLILRAFAELFRVLKPNRWITVVFHNSEPSIWNAIRDSLARAGFVIAQVAILDKKQGSYKQTVEAGSVKNDLMINAYKPKGAFSKAFIKNAGMGFEQAFLEQHLSRLPVEPNIERTDKMLYSKMLSYYIQHGYEISMNAQQFYFMLRNSFSERDGYYFLDSQVDSYESRKKFSSDKVIQVPLSITDEKSAIQWLYWFLSIPKSIAEIHPEFIKAQAVTKESIPELRELLEDNFVSEKDLFRRPQTTEKEQVDERREKRLLKEFNKYLQELSLNKKIQTFRKEAVVTGFTLLYREKRFDDILRLAKELPNFIIEGDIEIFDIIEVAKSKIA